MKLFKQEGEIRQSYSQAEKYGNAEQSSSMGKMQDQKLVTWHMLHGLKFSFQPQTDHFVAGRIFNYIKASYNTPLLFQSSP